MYKSTSSKVSSRDIKDDGSYSQKVDDKFGYELLSRNTDGIDPIDSSTHVMDNSKYEVAKVFKCPVWIDLGDNTLATIASTTLVKGLDSGVPLALSLNLSMNCFIGPMIIFGFCIFLATLILSIFCFYTKKKSTGKNERKPLVRGSVNVGIEYRDEYDGTENPSFRPQTGNVFAQTLDKSRPDTGNQITGKTTNVNFFENRNANNNLNNGNTNNKSLAVANRTRPYVNATTLTNQIISQTARNTISQHRQENFSHIKPTSVVISSNKRATQLIVHGDNNKNQTNQKVQIQTPTYASVLPNQIQNQNCNNNNNIVNSKAKNNTYINYSKTGILSSGVKRNDIILPKERPEVVRSKPVKNYNCLMNGNIE